ncbi:hypothetical protein FRB91_009749 [Serendipita sp. 411]|nr:hypothetical protein FRB91_009749 [Serendipita sp. 411]
MSYSPESYQYGLPPTAPALDLLPQVPGGPLSRVIICRQQGGQNRREDECLLLLRTTSLEVAKDEIRKFWKLPIGTPAIPPQISYQAPPQPGYGPPQQQQPFGYYGSKSPPPSVQTPQGPYQSTPPPAQTPKAQKSARIQLLYVEGDTTARLTDQVWEILKKDPDFRVVYWRHDYPESENVRNPTRPV